MFGSLFTMIFIVVIVSIILGATRSGRPELHESGYYPQIAPQQPIQPHAFYGPGGYQTPQYDPAAQQPISEASRRAIDEDITTFGDELRDLDLEVVGRTLDAAAQADYERALDAYDGAKNQLASARSNADVKRIAQIMEDGRYAIACVKARANGLPVPEHRPPCFFDPAHGVSVENVSWAPPGGAAREVPACAADAQRIRTGNDPYIRMVYQGTQQVPYWEDQHHAAWAQGYYGRYGMDPTLRAITHGALMIGGFSLLMGLLDD